MNTLGILYYSYFYCNYFYKYTDTSSYHCVTRGFKILENIFHIINTQFNRNGKILTQPSGTM